MRLWAEAEAERVTKACRWAPESVRATAHTGVDRAAGLWQLAALHCTAELSNVAWMDTIPKIRFLLC